MTQLSDDTNLRCVALPILARDIGPNLEAVLRLWADDRFFPAVGAATLRPNLMVVANCAGPEKLEEAEAIYRKFPRLAECFAGFSAVSADLRGDRDLYERDAPSAVGEFGNKAGPNFLFEKTMELAAAFGGFALQIELDCLPVQSGWLDATAEVIAVNARAWVIGSIFAGVRGLDRSVQTHLNGNGLYRAGNAAFQAFLKDIWMADILAQVKRRPNLAYDCWWAMELGQANALSGNGSWLRVQTYEAFFRNEPFIVNLLVTAEGLQDFTAVHDKFLRLDRQPVFFHGAAMNAVLQQLHADRSLTMFTAIDAIAPPKAPRDTLVPPARPMAATGPVAVSPVTGDSTLPASSDAAARQVIADYAGQVLLDPQVVAPEDAAGTGWRDTVQQARAQLGASADLVLHLDRVIDLATRKLRLAGD